MWLAVGKAISNSQEMACAKGPCRKHCTVGLGSPIPFFSIRMNLVTLLALSELLYLHLLEDMISDPGLSDSSG